MEKKDEITSEQKYEGQPADNLGRLRHKFKSLSFLSESYRAHLLTTTRQIDELDRAEKLVADTIIETRKTLTRLELRRDRLLQLGDEAASRLNTIEGHCAGYRNGTVRARVALEEEVQRVRRHRYAAVLKAAVGGPLPFPDFCAYEKKKVRQLIRKESAETFSQKLFSELPRLRRFIIQVTRPIPGLEQEQGLAPRQEILPVFPEPELPKGKLLDILNFYSLGKVVDFDDIQESEGTAARRAAQREAGAAGAIGDVGPNRKSPPHLRKSSAESKPQISYRLECTRASGDEEDEPAFSGNYLTPEEVEAALQGFDIDISRHDSPQSTGQGEDPAPAAAPSKRRGRGSRNP